MKVVVWQLLLYWIILVSIPLVYGWYLDWKLESLDVKQKEK